MLALLTTMIFLAKRTRLYLYWDGFLTFGNDGMFAVALPSSDLGLALCSATCDHDDKLTDNAKEIFSFSPV